MSPLIDPRVAKIMLIQIGLDLHHTSFSTLKKTRCFDGIPPKQQQTAVGPIQTAIKNILIMVTGALKQTEENLLAQSNGSNARPWAPCLLPSGRIHFKRVEVSASDLEKNTPR